MMARSLLWPVLELRELRPSLSIKYSANEMERFCDNFAPSSSQSKPLSLKQFCSLQKTAARYGKVGLLAVFFKSDLDYRANAAADICNMSDCST